MYFIKVVLISLVLFFNKNSSAQPEDHTTDQNEVEKCSSDKKVCGTDGKTYSNICLLQKETGVKLAHEGDCARRGKKKTAYRPDLILKSKIADNTEESLQKKLVKHFNPTTGKWEYVVEILPTIVITPTFHHLEMINDDQKPSSYNVTDIKSKPGLKTVGAVNASNELNVNNLPSPSFAKISAGTYPEKKLIIDSSQGPDNIITEIVGNVTNNFPRSQVENGVLVPIKNETIPSFNAIISHPNQSHPSVFPSRETSKITGKKSPVHQLQRVLNKQKSFNRVFQPIKSETIPSFNTGISHPNRSHPSVFPSRETSKITGKKSPVHQFQSVLNKQKSFNRVFGPIKSKTIPSFNTSIIHPNRSHPSVFPSRETGKKTGEKSPVHQFQTELNEPKSLDVKFGSGKIPAKEKQLTFNRTNQTNLQEPLSGNSILRPNLVATLPPSTPSISDLLKPPFKDALLKDNSIDNHSNEVQSRKNQTLPVKFSNTTDFRINGSLYTKNNEMPRTFHGKVTKTPQINAGNIPSQILNYIPQNYQIPIRTNVSHHPSYKNNTDHEINDVVKTKNVSSPYPTTTGKVTHTKRDNSQSIINNMTNTIPFKLPGDQEEFVNDAPLTGVTAVPVFPRPDVSIPIWHVPGPQITIPIQNEPIPHPKEDYDHQVRNVSQLTGEEPVIAIPPMDDSHGPVVNISQPITNITGLKDLSMKVNLHRDSEPKINIVLKPPHKNVSSSHPTTMDNTTHTALNISQPIMNNLTLGTLSRKIPEDHQKPVTNVSELLGKETVPPTTPVKDSAINISQLITNITGLKYLSMKDEYNPVRNTSQPIKKGPVSGDHPSGKLNIIPAPKKTEEIPKIMPNNGPNTHQIQPSFHSGYSNLTHSAARVPKLHGLIPPKHTPSIIENKGENTDQTKPNIDTKPESNTKWGTYYIKLPGNVSDNIDLVINWEILQLKTNQPNLMINVSEVVGSKNYTWPKDSKYATDTSIYHKLRSGSLKPINEKIKQVVNNDVWHNTNSRHPQFLVNTRKTGDVPINVTKTTEIKTYQLEDEVTLKENRKSGLLQNRKESKLGAYRYVSPLLQLPRSNKFGHNLEKYGSYSLDLPRNVAGNFKLIFTWTLRNKLPKSMRSPIDVTEKQVKYDYKWKIGGNNEGEKPTGNEEIQPIRSVNVTSHKSATPIKHSFGEKRLTGRKSPGRRLHDLAQGLRNVHLDIPKTTTKPQIDTTSAPVKTEEITPAGTKLYPGWYYMEMLFKVPGGGGGCSANNNNCTNLNNYNDTRKSQIDPTDLSSFNKSRLSLLPMDYPSFLDKYAFVRAKAHQGKCNCNNDKTKK